jgi:hypothetical protein
VSGADNLTALKYIVMKFNNTRAGLIYWGRRGKGSNEFGTWSLLPV